MKDTIVMFDESDTQTKVIFEKHWSTEPRVSTQTANYQNITDMEKNDTGSRTIYIGQEEDIKKKVELNKGIYLNSVEFATFSQVSSIQNKGMNIVKPRSFSKKIKNLMKLGIHFKNTNKYA